MQRRRLLSLISMILCVSVVFYGVFVLDAPKAKAWPVSISLANIFPEAGSMLANVGSYLMTAARWVADTLGVHLVIVYKIAALLAVQYATRAIIGGSKGDTVIHDFGAYLYVSPQQRAMGQMTIFFNTTSRGRLSATNYEGVGPNYDAYLVAQARQSIAGRPFTTNIQNQVTDPSQLFSGGNMKGIMAYMQCANNVACYTLTAADKYASEFTKAQDVARSEQSNGFLPRKLNGRITSPAALAQNALLQTDQLGTQVIMNAEAKTKSEVSGALLQITEGAAISIASRAANYYISDDAGKQAIRNKNDEFPFSLAYSATGGFGVNAGKITSYTGVGTLGNMQIGNTCGTAGFVVSPQGQAVTINGQKQTCVPSPRCIAAGGSCMALCSGAQVTGFNNDCVAPTSICCK